MENIVDLVAENFSSIYERPDSRNYSENINYNNILTSI